MCFAGVLGFGDVQMSGCADLWICECADVGMCWDEKFNLYIGFGFLLLWGE